LIVCSFLGLQLYWARQQRLAAQAIAAAGGKVYYSLVNAPSPYLAWLQRVTGEPESPDVNGVRLSGLTVSDGVFAKLSSLRHLQSLYLADTNTTDAALRHISGLAELEILDLDRTLVTDAVMQHLKALARLECLYLGQTKVTDAGLPYLSGLQRVTQLDLSGTGVTDSGLEFLNRMTRLGMLDLNGTAVTSDGARKLFRGRPGRLVTIGVAVHGVRLSDHTTTDMAEKK
jgi:hypothetical protein